MSTVSERTEKQIASRLNSHEQGFLRDAGLFGINYAISQYHLSDLPFNELYDWTQQHCESKVYSQRGTLHDPREPGVAYMDDFLTAVLNRFTGYEKEIAELKTENEDLRRTITYHRSHPLDETHEKMAEVLNDKKAEKYGHR